MAKKFLSRTRSGMLDRFDLTGIEDSDDEESNSKKTCEHEVPIHKHQLSSFARFVTEKSTLVPVSPDTIVESVATNNEDDEVIEITEQSTRGNNPFLDFPHRREDCQRFEFTTNPELFCRKCYCYICDAPASECSSWHVSDSSKISHCFAKHSDTGSRLQRKSIQMRKHTLRPRQSLLPPIRLRSSSGMLSCTTNQTKAKRKVIQLSDRFPNLSHDLFLPGKEKHQNLASSINQSHEPTKTNKRRQTMDRTLLKCPTETKRRLSRKRSIGSSPQEEIRGRRTFTKQVATPSTLTSKSARRKENQTSVGTTCHFTRSRRNANDTRSPSLYGTLGAYWRGEPTKYAGVPYRKRLSSTGGKKLIRNTTGNRVSGKQVLVTGSEIDATQTCGGLENEYTSATLEGTISYDSHSQRYSILGTWYCPWSKSFPPQKFGLVQNFREGQKRSESTMNGTYDGYCVVTTRSFDAKGNPIYHDSLIFESDVVLEFRSKIDATRHKSLVVDGFGSNKVGSFRISGEAKPCARAHDSNGNCKYTVLLEKRYYPNLTSTESSYADVTDRKSRSTRSNSSFEKGIIVRKLFNDGAYNEGEVIGYDPIRKQYKIQYTNGNVEDFDNADVKKHYKHLQRYSHASYAQKQPLARPLHDNHPM